MGAEPNVTWGFWVGIFAGMIIGTFVFGVAIIGQGLWNEGFWAGQLSCRVETRHDL